MITLADFITEYAGKFVNYDTVYGPQCMDLFRQYAKDVLGFPQSKGVSNAWEVFFNFDPELWEKIPYRKGIHPTPGCVVIWSRYYSKSLTGHIAVYVRPGETLPMLCFSQNDPPKNDKSKRFAMLREYGYRHVLGWLRPRREVA